MDMACSLPCALYRPISYTRERLYYYRRQVSGSANNHSAILSTLAALRLLKFRGSRGGRNVLRPITTTIGRRPFISASAQHHFIHKRWLTPIPATPLVSSRRFGCVNAQSMNNKSTILRSVVDDNNLDVFGISETW